MGSTRKAPIRQAWNDRGRGMSGGIILAPDHSNLPVERDPCTDQMFGTKRILVIDDDEDIREVAKASLEGLGGWEVLVASTGSEGVAKAEEFHPNAVLLDYFMDDMDGPDVLRLLRHSKNCAAVPVIFLTGKAETLDLQQFEGMGVIGVIAKPFDPFRLSQQVAEALGRDE